MVAFTEQAPLRGAFFVLVCCLLHLPFVSASPAADCQAPDRTEHQHIRFVIDGDTLRLNSGRDVRLIGLDTPELSHGEGEDKPFARAARSALSALIERSGGEVLLQTGSDPQDRYRRRLAHVYTPDGDNLTAELLRQGLGFQAVVAPNLAHIDCYRRAETEARQAGRGLWRNGVDDAAKTDEPGFHLLHGRVVKVGQSRRAVWLNLEGDIEVKVPHPVWRALTSASPKAFLNRRLEVRGWFYRQRERLRVKVSHPASIHWQ
jgi:endonuclease YncB( thermonuclease family)